MVIKSELAHMREHIQRECEAAERGLTGLAGEVARHAVINRKTTNFYEYLKATVGPQEAVAALAALYEEIGGQQGSDNEHRA
jgi:hypothetical protein